MKELLVLLFLLLQTPWGVQDVQADAVWALTRGAGMTVAVVDSGVDISHPVLDGHVTDGYDVWDDDPDPLDVCGHGTALASIVAMVAPEAAIMPVKAMSDECYGTYSRLITGIEYATDAGAQIILVASGAYAPTPQLEAAVRYAQERGVLVIGGAGNDATNAPFYPAAYGMTVTATNRTGGLYWRSNYGPHVDLAAPGVEVEAAHPDNAWVVTSGTSMAAAHAAGAAALVWSAQPQLTAEELADLLRETADDCGLIGYDEYCGHGRVNAWNAVAPHCTDLWLPLIEGRKGA